MGEVIRKEVVEEKLIAVSQAVNTLLRLQAQLNGFIAQNANTWSLVGNLLGVGEKIGIGSSLNADLAADEVEKADLLVRAQLASLRSWLKNAGLSQTNPRGIFIIKTRKRMPPGKY